MQMKSCIPLDSSFKKKLIVISIQISLSFELVKVLDLDWQPALWRVSTVPPAVERGPEEQRQGDALEPRDPGGGADQPRGWAVPGGRIRTQ